MDTFEKLREIISQNTDVNEENISLETTLDELGLDSIDLVDLIMSVEEAFSINVPDEEFENIKSVSDIVGIIDNM